MCKSARRDKKKQRSRYGKCQPVSYKAAPILDWPTGPGFGASVGLNRGDSDAILISAKRGF